MDIKEEVSVLEQSLVAMLRISQLALGVSQTEWYIPTSRMTAGF
jgi:hypothetical protein